MVRLRALGLSHFNLPLGFESIPMGLAHVVQNAASQDHGGHHVQPAVVPLAKALPASSQPQQRLLRHAQRSVELLIKHLLPLRQGGVVLPPAPFLWESLHQPALKRVAGLTQHHIPGEGRHSFVSMKK